jgi:hypothetical protein
MRIISDFEPIRDRFVSPVVAMSMRCGCEQEILCTFCIAFGEEQSF